MSGSFPYDIFEFSLKVNEISIMPDFSSRLII